MLVILEGCDGSGKSTLARSLAKVLGAEIIHCTSTTPNDKKFFEGIIEASKTRNIIADRFCYGQFVYQKEKDRPLGSFQNLHRLETKMLKAGVRVVYVEAPLEEIEKRLNDRGEKVINGLTVEEVMVRFEDVLSNQSMMGGRLIRWNTGGEWK